MADSSTNSRSELMQLLDTYVGVYKHHFDLFVKAVFLYFAILGGAGSYIVGTGADANSKPLLVFLLCTVSVLFFVANVISLVWVRNIKTVVDGVCSDLGIRKFPFGGALGVIVVVMVLTIVAVVAALLVLRQTVA